MKTFQSVITPGNINPKNTHIYLTSLLAELPLDVHGGSSKLEMASRRLILEFQGDKIETDIPKDHRTIFRDRAFARRFLAETDAQVGDRVIFEQITPYHYRMYMKKLDGSTVGRVGIDDFSRIDHWSRVRTRPNQQKFRREVAERDGLNCAITGCAIPEVLEAAHIVPYRKDVELRNKPENGLVLRADLHKLFDALILSVDPSARVVVIAPDIGDDGYLSLEGRRVESGASTIFLADHYRRFKELKR